MMVDRKDCINSSLSCSKYAWLIGEKTISQVQEKTEDITINSYTFITSDNDKTHAYFQSLEANRQNGNVTLVMKRDEIPRIIKTLIGMEIDIYAVNQRQRTLEQDFITMTSGAKTRIR